MDVWAAGAVLAELYTGLYLLFKWNGCEFSGAENIEYIGKALGVDTNIPGYWTHPLKTSNCTNSPNNSNFADTRKSALFEESFVRGVRERQTDMEQAVF